MEEICSPSPGFLLGLDHRLGVLRWDVARRKAWSLWLEYVDPEGKNPKKSPLIAHLNEWYAIMSEFVADRTDEKIFTFGREPQYEKSSAAGAMRPLLVTIQAAVATPNGKRVHNCNRSHSRLRGCYRTML